jgi:hypothetical protein
MIPQYLNLLIRLMSAVVFLSTAAGEGADPPRPTPRPGSLAAYAEAITLDRSALADANGRVILTNDSVKGLAADGSITLGALALAAKSKTDSVATNAERARWQAAYRKQRQVIAALERRRTRLEIEIDQIENQGLTARTMARVERLKPELRQLDRDIATERAVLARIVRDARRRGAEPGWFR